MFYLFLEARKIIGQTVMSFHSKIDEVFLWAA